MLDISFHGVRGSTPCSSPAVARYGGNTSCVVVEVPGEAPILCDLGTGVRYYGAAWPVDRPFRGTALLSHLHWDHIQGLPFFTPVLRPGADLEIVGPPQELGSLERAMGEAISPPLFPIGLDQLPGRLRFRELARGCIEVGSATVTAFPVAHVGPTSGYRIQSGAGSVAYISDHQQPTDGSGHVPPLVADHCRGVDVLIHDAQYDADEFALKADWGHCTVEYAVEVALVAGAARLVLFHHDPTHDDDWIDRALDRARAAADGACEVLAANEGLVLSSGGPSPGRSPGPSLRP